MNIDFERLEDEVMELLRNKKVAVLATSSSDRVTARSVSYVVLNSRMYIMALLMHIPIWKMKWL